MKMQTSMNPRRYMYPSPAVNDHPTAITKKVDPLHRSGVQMTGIAIWAGIESESADKETAVPSGSRGKSWATRRGISGVTQAILGVAGLAGFRGRMGCRADYCLVAAAGAQEMVVVESAELCLACTVPSICLDQRWVVRYVVREFFCV
jgi:hypothetical protein